MVERQWRGTGHATEVPGHVDRIPAYDPRSGDHLWTVATMFRVHPERMNGDDGPPLLDQENLITLVGPACYWCEQPYDARMRHRRCPGPR